VTPLEDLPPALALELDALCDDFERHWRRSRRRGAAAPDVEAFVSRASPAAQTSLRRCLLELERDLLLGVALPEVPGFDLEAEIGRGGMGVVYRARRTSDGRAVALKLIPGEEHARWSSWMAELIELRHPNLVPLEAFGSHGGLYFVVMPLVRGGDLKERLSEFVVGPNPQGGSLRRVASIVARVADAVGYLHGHGIVHRDLKPSNVLLLGDEPEPLVGDFGLAARLGASTTGTPAAGTPPYVAPELLEGGAVTAAADVWSLGAVLHELLTGRPIGEGETGAGGGLGDACRRCLRRDPAERYRTAVELAADLRRAGDDS
jgi:eukaryotic-like serine/threonine-protein kinase